MGWVNPQVTPRGGAQKLPVGATKVDPNRAPQTVGEPQWQRVVSVIAIVLLGIFWLTMFLRPFFTQ